MADLYKRAGKALVGSDPGAGVLYVTTPHGQVSLTVGEALWLLDELGCHIARSLDDDPWATLHWVNERLGVDMRRFDEKQPPLVRNLDNLRATVKGE